MNGATTGSSAAFSALAMRPVVGSISPKVASHARATWADQSTPSGSLPVSCQ
jgi:hypothetical protein